MSLSISSLFAGFVFGVIGLWLLREAKRRAHLKLIPIAILLMGYSYFTPNAFWDWAIGVILCAATYYLWNS